MKAPRLCKCCIDQTDWSEVASHGTNFSYTPTRFLQEVYMKYIHLLSSNLIGQNLQAMVQDINFIHLLYLNLIGQKL